MNLSNIKTVLLFLINIYSIMKTAQFRKRIIFNIFGIALYRAGSCPSGRSMPPNLSLIHSLASLSLFSPKILLPIIQCTALRYFPCKGCTVRYALLLIKCLAMILKELIQLQRRISTQHLLSFLHKSFVWSEA